MKLLPTKFNAATTKFIVILSSLIYITYAFTITTPPLNSATTTTFTSILIFLGITAFSLTSLKRYWLALPIIALAVPNAVNDIFPSLPMGVTDSLGLEIPLFSLFTHIDIFLILGILRFSQDVNRNTGAPSKTIAILLAFYSATTIASTHTEISLMGGYQIRYLVLSAILAKYCRPTDHLEEIQKGIMLGTLLLIAEASIFTLSVAKSDRLTSGNFGVNTFGHILAAISAYTFFSKTGIIKKYLLITATLAACIASGTRFSIISLPAAILITHVLASRNISRKLIAFYLTPITAALILYSTPQGQSIVSVAASIASASSSLHNIYTTDESSSIITRLILWDGTVKMIGEYPALGVGPAVWSYINQYYGIPFDQILDPHNDPLNFLVSYGVPAAIIMMYLIYVHPIVSTLKKPTNKSPNTLAFLAFNISLIISGLSNAALWKHQVALLMITSALILITQSKQSNQNIQT